MADLSLETSSGPLLLRNLQLINRSKDNDVDNIKRKDQANFSQAKYQLETNLSKEISRFNFSLASLASVFRFFSSFGLMKDFGAKVTKLVLSAACMLNGSLALLGGRSWDGMALFLEPVLHFLFRKSDIDVGNNIALAISQMIVANEGYVPRLFAGQKLQAKDFKNDLNNNAQAFKRICSELLSGGLGSKRRFFTGMTPTFIKEKLKRIASGFNIYGAWEAFKLIFNRSSSSPTREAYLMFMRRTGLFRLQEIFAGDSQRDRGHTHYLSSLALLGSSIFTTIFSGAQKKLAALVDFAANLFTAASIFGHPDTKRSVAGMSLGFSAITGALKSFLFARSSVLDALTGSFGLMGSMLHLNRTIQRTQENEVSYKTGTKTQLDAVTLAKKPEIILQEKIMREDLRKHPDRVYLYADNLMMDGYGSQAAEMRGEPNAIALPAMRTPYDDVDAYLSDKDYASNVAHIDQAFAQIPKDRSVVIPVTKDKDGRLTPSIGLGLAYMRDKAYVTYCYLQTKFAELIASMSPQSLSPSSVA